MLFRSEGYLTGLARAYTPWCETEDLKQEAALALLDAAGYFDPTHGTKLLTYATPAIEAAMMDYAARYSSSHPFPSAGTINCAGWHTSAPRDGTHLMLSWSRWCAEN